MNLFNNLVQSIINEIVSGDVYSTTGEYNPGDNRPITPSNIILGTKKKGRKKKQHIYRRTLY